MQTPRIYLTGGVAIEYGERLIRERDFPSRQGCLAFVFLTLHRHRPVYRDELLNALWSDGGRDGALDPVLSKLRSLLRATGLCATDGGIRASSGTVSLELPATSWVDFEAATNALDEAEGALRRNDPAAWALANTAVVITRRPFLANAEAPWIESQRHVLRAMQLRALQCLVTVSANNGETSLAIQHASEMVQLEPFRETSYQLLMRMHTLAGDRAEALRVFARCREFLRDELGVAPSPQTEAVFLEILRMN